MHGQSPHKPFVIVRASSAR